MKITTDCEDEDYDYIKYCVAMRELRSILDNESNFPAFVRPGMRSRIIEFTHVATAGGTAEFISNNDSDNDSDSDNDNDSDSDSDSDSDNDNYRAAVQAMRSIIVESDQLEFASVVSASIKFLVRSRLLLFAQNFFKKTFDDVHTWMYLQEIDRKVDTNEQVETAITFFPEVLSEATEWEADRFELCAVKAAAIVTDENGVKGINTKAISFVPQLVKLAIKFNRFEERSRGGLLFDAKNEHGFLEIEAANLFKELPLHSYTDEEDELCLDVIKKLRAMGYFKKEDIQDHRILDCCYKLNEGGRDKMFRYFADWDPDALAQRLPNGRLLLHHTSTYCTIEAFKIELEAGLRHFPRKFGFLFHKDNSGMTPFKYACDNYGEEATKDIVDSFFIAAQKEFSSVTKPWSMDVFLSAISDEKFDLDGLYSVLRRDPAMLQQLLVVVGVEDRSSPKRQCDGLLLDRSSPKRQCDGLEKS